MSRSFQHFIINLKNFITIWISVFFFLIFIVTPTAATAATLPDTYYPDSERIILPNPAGVEASKLDLFIDARDRLFVLNLKANQITIFNRQGTGKTLPLNLPKEVVAKSAGFWVSGDTIYLKPGNDNWVWFYNTSGQFIRKLELKAPRDSYFLPGITVNKRGFIYLVDSMKQRVRVFFPTGKYRGVFAKYSRRGYHLPGAPDCSFVDNNGDIYFSVRIPGIEKSLLIKYSFRGFPVFYSDEPPIHYYTAIWVDRNRNLYAVAPNESLVVKFDRRGRKICQFRTGCSTGIAVDSQGAVYLSSPAKDSIIRMYPSLVNRLIDRGNVVYYEQSIEKAEPYFRKACVLDNQAKYAHLRLGEIYFRQRQWRQAMSQFEYLKDSRRYSRALANFRQSQLNNYWPYLGFGFIIIGFTVYTFFRVLKNRRFLKYFSFVKVIWSPARTLRLKTRTAGPITAWILILVFGVTHYFSRYYTSPIFTGTHPVFSLPSFARELAVILALFLIWSVIVYKVGELFQGLAKYRQVLNGAAFCLMPLIVGEPALALLSQFWALNQYWIYQGISYTLIIWVIILLYRKIQLTEAFHWGKTLGVGLIILMAMSMFLVFLGFLFGVNQQLISFLQEIYNEIYNRLTT